MVRIRTVAFDADGVIQHWSLDDLCSRLEATLGLLVAENREQLVREIFDAERPALSGQVDFAQEVLFIDDLEANVAGARGAGLQAEAFVHPRTSSGVPQVTRLLQRYAVLDGI